MRFAFILVWGLGMALLPVAAHEANQAFFFFSQEDTHLEIRAEFPWTIREALIQFRPHLKQAQSKEDFLKALEEYIRLNLLLIDQKNRSLKLLSLSEIKTEGHEHQNTFLLRYEKGELQKVRNTIMFNIFEKQVNFHEYPSERQKFETTLKQASFILVKKNQGYYYGWFALGILPLLFYLWKVWNK